MKKKQISEEAEFSRGRNFLLVSINCELGTFWMLSDES